VWCACVWCGGGQVENRREEMTVIVVHGDGKVSRVTFLKGTPV
jgi:hypothetical protein